MIFPFMRPPPTFNGTSGIEKRGVNEGISLLPNAGGRGILEERNDK
jgi:hypothetical protein